MKFLENAVKLYAKLKGEGIKLKILDPKQKSFANENIRKWGCKLISIGGTINHKNKSSVQIDGFYLKFQEIEAMTYECYFQNGWPGKIFNHYEIKERFNRRDKFNQEDIIYQLNNKNPVIGRTQTGEKSFHFYLITGYKRNRKGVVTFLINDSYGRDPFLDGVSMKFFYKRKGKKIFSRRTLTRIEYWT